MYKELSTQLNFPAIEEEILAYWDKNQIFKKSVESRDENRPFIFYEGPPTANGRPGIHHVISRTIKDLVCRFKTMEGYRVERKAGWDTHGLPVEIEVEKQLGFTRKDEIEKYGVTRFNQLCRESVWKYKKEWDELTRRIAFWVDLEHPYITYENNYIESVWWILSEFWKKELIYRGHKIVPYCPRCETPLSSHEVSLGYKDVEDPSVYVRMRVKGENDTSFLVWTTTPWTLISNVALALHPDIKYVKIKTGNEYLILAEARLAVLSDTPPVRRGGSASRTRAGDPIRGKDEYEIVASYSGSELAGKEYEPLYSFCQSELKMHYTVLGDFVSTEDGSGIVHIAPAFGEDDYQIGLKYNLPVLQPVDKSGKFTDEVTLFKEKFVKAADGEIIKELKSRGLLYKAEKYLHSYPHCWRCSSPLLYYAKKSWFLRTTAKKDRLIHHNKTIKWYPKEVGEGRFGEWLENNVDWSLSRERYWGTPLPFWVCGECQHGICIGSVYELKRLSGLQQDIDLHKPYIDDVRIPCPKCRGQMSRTPEVLDVWFDSGSMPVAQWHYPFENREKFEKSFPADFISEGVDQTRGWFYSLLAIAVLLFDKPCYKTCISNDLILDKFGQKMSKSKGNTVDPWIILKEQGADALRWYLLTVSPPWVPTRFDIEGVVEVVRKFLGTLLNVYSFFAMYANVDKFVYEKPSVAVAKRAEIDRWLLSSLNHLVEKIENYLSRYDLTKAARAISDFVIDDVSNWYVRRCRRRFWKSEMGEDKLAAYETLYEVLYTLSKLMAPFTPFIAEEIYQNLTAGKQGELQSVHLAFYPKTSAAEYFYRDRALEERMDLVRRVVVLGRALRNASAIKVRQPLPRIVVVARDAEFQKKVAGMTNLILEELNVKRIDFVSDARELVSRRANPKFKQLGPKFGKDVNAVAERIRALTNSEVETLQEKGEFSFELNRRSCTVALDDVEVFSESAAGLLVQSEGDLTVALDTHITAELEMEGLAREFVNRVQNMRKKAGLEVVDRIKIFYQTDDTLQKAISAQAQYICSETLAEVLAQNSARHGYVEEWDIDGFKAVIGIEKV